MSRAVITSSTDQSIRVWAYNSSGAAITGEAYNSAGIAVSVVVRSAGRIVSTTALTLVARATVGEHRDKAFTEVGAGEYVVDLEDSYFTTANRQVSVTLTSTAISGGYVLSETLDVGVRVELDSVTSAKIDSILEDTGTTLPAQIDAIEGGGGSGTGARTVTITVNDGATAIQNAVVRMTEGVNTYTATTNVSGVATFNLDDATYTVGISKAGYSYSGTTIVVNGTETATYSMTAISVTPGSGSLTTGYLTCLDEEGAAEENVSVRCQMVQVPASGTGIAYDAAVQLDTSDADGLVEFPMIKGARYLVWRGSIKPPQGLAPVLISASAGTTTALGSLIGVD